MNLLLGYIFFGIIGYLKLIHLDLAYANKVIDDDEYADAAKDANETVDKCVDRISGKRSNDE